MNVVGGVSSPFGGSSFDGSSFGDWSSNESSPMGESKYHEPPAAGLVGGVVEETGIALVHEGEVILPAVGSEAEVRAADADARMNVTINIPVIVEVGSSSNGESTDAIVDATLRRLRQALSAHDSF